MALIWWMDGIDLVDRWMELIWWIDGFDLVDGWMDLMDVWMDRSTD